MSEENWRQGSVLEQQKHMLETGFLSDCKFLVGQEPDTKEFRTHKFPLSRSSEVFHAMFYGSLSEKDVVRVTDVTPEAFQALLNHVYYDTLEISDVEMSLSVCSAAHKYNIQTLISKCSDYITKHMVPANVWQILDFSNLTNNTELQKNCIKMLQCRTEEVLSADSWCDVQESSIVTLLQQDTLNVDSELSLLSACQRWAQHQLDINNPPDVNNDSQDNNQSDVNFESNISEASVSKRARYEENNLRKMLAPFLPYLRILSLTAKQYLDATEEHELFSKQEQHAILKCVADPQKYKMPEGICEIKDARQKAPPLSFSTLDEIIERLKSTRIKSSNFLLNSYKLTYKSSTHVTVTINNHIIVYGFSYTTLQLANLERVERARVSRSSTNEYAENFTVQFKNEADKSVVAEYKYKGMLQYDTVMKVDFPKPFLAQKSIPHSLKVDFHHQHTDRKYRFYQKYIKVDMVNGKYVPDDLDIYGYNGISVDFPSINELFYKLV